MVYSSNLIHPHWPKVSRHEDPILNVGALFLYFSWHLFIEGSQGRDMETRPGAGCCWGWQWGWRPFGGPGYVKVQAHCPAGGWPDPGSRRPLHSVLMAAVLPAPVSVAPHVALSAATAGLRFPLSLSLSFSLGFSLSPPPLSSV